MAAQQQQHQRFMRYERLQTGENSDHDTIRRNHKAQDEQEEIELNHNELEDSGGEDSYGLNAYAHEQHALEANNIHFQASRRFMQMAIATLALILLYLTLSICLTFYQSHLLKEIEFPLSMATYHMFIKFLMAGCARILHRWYRGKPRVVLDWKNTLRKMAPTGIASGMDIGFSMWGMELVKISLYTMTKSTTIIFITFFAILLGLEKKSWSLISIVALISSGLFMFTYKTPEFNLLGFSFLIIASLSSGIRWTLAQFLIQKSQLGLHNPIDMIYHMQPWMFATLLPMTIMFERHKLMDALMLIPHTDTSVFVSILVKVTFGAMLAFFMEVSEFMVLSKTSSITLSIAGIFKETCQMALAVEYYHDKLSLMNVIGMITCLLGIACHVAHKYTVLRRMDAMQTLNNDESLFNETSMDIEHENVASGGGLSGLVGAGVLNRKHSAQSVPLLDELSDSFDSEELEDGPNASDVIFDVLKRRDM